MGSDNAPGLQRDAPRLRMALPARASAGLSHPVYQTHRRRNPERAKEMKCDCQTCNGNGRIVCPECDGAGNSEASIDNIKIPVNHRHRDELLLLRSDAIRINSQARELTKLNPSKADSYTQQAAAALAEVEKQAGKLWTNSK